MKREHYIPFDKERLLDLLINDFKYNLNETNDVKKLFKILEHYFHYEGFNQIQSLKRDYAYYDPDKTSSERNEYEGKSNLSIFNENLKYVLERGNYKEVEEEQLNEALANSDLVGLQLKINFDYFKSFKVFVRGFEKDTETISHYFFWKKQKEIECFDRVIIYIEYKDEHYFKKIKKDISELTFAPSCVILKIFKRVPKNDLETIFPNAIPKMSIKDKLLLWIPAIAGGVPLITTKVIPPILAMYSAVKFGETFEGEKVKKSLLEGLIALGLVGAYLIRQYRKFVNKKMHFSKLLSDSLYFKNIANNSGVFPALIDAAEDEELKEIIIAYLFLNQSSNGLTSKELDEKIEQWFLSRFGKDLDFDIEDALQKIEKLGIGHQLDGKWIVISSQKALEKVDEIWDSIFDYNKKHKEANT